MKDLYKIRKANLMGLVLSKFTGNRAAMARAAAVHPNHMNLILSSNETHRRNIGEDLARRIEVSLSLPDKWLDHLHGTENRETLVSISSLPIQSSLSHILKESPVTGISASNAWILSVSSEATAVENLFLSTIATGEMSPLLSVGDLVIVDGASKGFSVEGTYILAVGDDALLRHIKKTITGGYLVSSGASEERIDSLSSLKIIGRIVQKMQMIRV